MAKRASKPKDPRTKEEVAKQKKTPGLKQPAITKARKAVGKEKAVKKAKGAKIEASAASKRRKSSPSSPMLGPKTKEETPPTTINFDRPETTGGAQPTERAGNDPTVRAANKRRLDSQRLAQIGKPDSATPAEKLYMQEIFYTTPKSGIEKEAPSPADPLRPKITPLSDAVRSPFATGGAYTFDAPDRALEAPAKASQSTDANDKVSKDLARRVAKGVDRGDANLNLPGTPEIRQRALEIAKKGHEREVELGKAHPLDVPTDSTPEVTTGHPMRQAIVEAGFSATESHLRSFASAKGMRFEDAVHGLFNTAQQASAKDSPVEARVRTNPETGRKEAYDATKGTQPSVNGFDLRLLDYLTADIHRKEGPKPAIEPRDRPRLKAQNIVEELTGPKRSGEFSGKAKGGIAPRYYNSDLLPEIDDKLNYTYVDPKTGEEDPYRGDPFTPGAGKSPTGDIARSGAGMYAPQPVKDLPKPPGKKPKGFGGATDSMGGAIPGPTKNPRVSRSDRNRRQTPASSPTYRLSSAPARVAEPTQTSRDVQFEQLELFPPVRELKTRTLPTKDKKGNLVKTTDLPEPIKYLDPNTRAELSSKQRKASDTLGENAFSFGTTLEPVFKKKTGDLPPRPQTPASTESSGAKYTQPFLETSLSQAKLAEKFPRDYAKVDSEGNPKKPTVWNMQSRQFLPGKEVETSPATRSLQSEANMIRGKKDTMFEPPKSDKANIEKI